MSASHLFAIHSTYVDIEAGSHQTTSFNADNQVPTPNVPEYAILERISEDEGEVPTPNVPEYAILERISEDEGEVPTPNVPEYAILERISEDEGEDEGTAV